MNTNFFSSIQKMIANFGSVSISVSSHDDGKMTVSVLPKPKAGVTDEALSGLSPMILSGDVQDLDEQFFTQIATITEKTNALFSSVADFEKNLEETKKKTAMERDAKNKEDEAKKKQAKERDANDVKAKEAITCAEDTLKAKDIEKAKKSLTALEKFKEEKVSPAMWSKIQKAIAEVKEVVSSPTLF